MNNNDKSINNNNMNMKYYINNEQMESQMLVQAGKAQQESLNNNNLNKIVLSVIFKVNGSSSAFPILVKCFPDEKVSSIIEKYRNISGNEDPSTKFIFNANPLPPNLTVAQAGLKNFSNIFITTNEGIKG